jgi:triacylglycerol lipase
MRRLEKHLRSQGRLVFAPSLRPATGSASIEELAVQLASFAAQNVPGGKFDLVAFSMGGLVSRYYMQRLGGLKRVEHFVTMATPHQGTKMAWLHPGQGAMQMRPRSRFLQDLDRDADVLRTIKFTSFYTPLDAIVIPARSSVGPQAQNICMVVPIHPSFLLEKRCLKAVDRALGGL